MRKGQYKDGDVVCSLSFSAKRDNKNHRCCDRSRQRIFLYQWNHERGLCDRYDNLGIYALFQPGMLMYGKEASNRKQEIDRQHHTIPNKRTKDKHYGNVHNRLWNHG